jgi:hypothetical protein
MKSTTLSDLLLSAAVAGLLVGSSATAQQKQSAKKVPAKSATEMKKDKDSCKGKDGCNGKADSSKVDSSKSKSKDSCKGKDGCKGKDEKKKD